MSDYFGRILVDSNLVLSYKAIVKNESIENVFRRVNNFASNFYKTDELIGPEIVIVSLLVERRREPNYLLVSYVNRQGLLYGAIAISTYTEIIFEQSHHDVEVTVKMYPKFPVYGRSKSRFDDERMARLRRNAELSWIDFILEIFRVAGVDNYDEIKQGLLTEDVVKEREEIADSYRLETIKGFKQLAIGTVVFLFLLWILSKLF